MPGYRDDAYLKSITIEPTKSGTREPTGEVRTIECAYDAEQVKGLTLKTMSCIRLVCPGPNGATTEQIAESLSSPARQALREWAEYPSRTNSSQTVEKLWLVRTYRRTIRYCPFAESGAVLVSYAAEGYPLKALLPVPDSPYGRSVWCWRYSARQCCPVRSCASGATGARRAGMPRNDSRACTRS